jgi:hypothetical protein
MFTPAIQIMESAKSEAEAIVMFCAISIQQGVLAARMLPPCGQVGKNTWRVQAIMGTNGQYPNGWLPDGMSHVMWRGYF